MPLLRRSWARWRREMDLFNWRLPSCYSTVSLILNSVLRTSVGPIHYGSEKQVTDGIKQLSLTVAWFSCGRIVTDNQLLNFMKELKKIERSVFRICETRRENLLVSWKDEVKRSCNVRMDKKVYAGSASWPDTSRPEKPRPTIFCQLKLKPSPSFSENADRQNHSSVRSEKCYWQHGRMLSTNRTVKKGGLLLLD